MSGDRWRIAGLSDPRAAWFSELARWSTAAAVPVDFVKCVSVDELRTRLIVGEAYSALLLGSDAAGVSRDLIAEALGHGAAVIVVGDAMAGPWLELGASAVLPDSFDRADLLAVLADHASPDVPAEEPRTGEGLPSPSGWRGRLVSVTGSGGAGSSVLAMGLAGGLAAEASNRGLVMLADLALNADQAMMHDSRDVMPGLQELVEAGQGGQVGPDLLGSMVFEPAGRGYHLLLGLRRHRDWIAIRRRPLEAALDAVLRTYRFVVADTDADIEGLSDTGSVDVESRNVLARTAIERSDLVVVVGTGGTQGLNSLVRTIGSLVDGGVGADRLLPVINRSPRSRPRRAAATSAVTRLLAETAAADVGDVLLVAERHEVEKTLRDGRLPPAALGRELAAAVRRRLSSASSGDEAVAEASVSGRSA